MADCGAVGHGLGQIAVVVADWTRLRPVGGRCAFGVPKVAVQRAVDRYRAGGAAAFFVPPKPRTGRKLTPEILRQAQGLLDEGQLVPQISHATGVLANTIHKAVRHGRLRVGAKKKTRPSAR